MTVAELMRLLRSLPPGSQDARVTIEQRGRFLPVRAALVVPGDLALGEETRVALFSTTVVELPRDDAPDGK